MPDENVAATQVTETLVSRKLQLSVRDGVTATGNSALKNRSYSNVNEDADAEAMYNTGVALASLVENELANVYYDDKKKLQEVEVSGD